MTEQHPITPPQELVNQWRIQAPVARDGGATREQWIAIRAARWGADTQLERDCEWLTDQSLHLDGSYLRDAMERWPSFDGRLWSHEAAAASAALSEPADGPAAVAPPPEGEVAELVADLQECADSCILSSKPYWAAPMRRAAELLEQIPQLQHELERERMRLVACGVVAMSDTPESAAKARDCHPDYWSASADDIARQIDELMRLRAQQSFTPPPEGEVAELVAWLREEAAEQRPGDSDGLPSDVRDCLAAATAHLTRAADLLERQAAPEPLPTFRDAIQLAQGCHDYSGGYGGTPCADAFHAGIDTVASVLRKASSGPWDQQTRIVFAVGANLPLPAPAGEVE